MKTKECHGYAETYLKQPTNPALIILPALDGERDEPILTCFDRTSREDAEYAHMVKCPMCEDGWHRDTKVHYFRGDPVYAKFLVEAHKDIEVMKAIGWLDGQTQ